MKSPSLSIVIPTIGRNVLDQTIESVLNQSELPDEIVVWDNSGNNIAQIQSKYRNHEKILWFATQKRLPIIDSWNSAVMHTSGEFVYILGDDDLLAPNFVNKVRKTLISGSQLIYAKEAIIDQNGAILSTNFSQGNANSNLDDTSFIEKYSKGEFIIYLGSLIFPRRIFDKIGGYKNFTMNALSMDVLFTIEMLKSIKHITLINTPIWKYRTLSNDWSGKLKHTSDIPILAKQHWEYRDYVKKYFTEDWKKHWSKFYKRWLVSSMVKVCYLTSPLKTCKLLFSQELTMQDRIFILRDIFYMFRHYRKQ